MSFIPVKLMLSLVLFPTVLLVLSTIGRWRIFKKSGYPGVLSVIPVVNMFIYGFIAKRVKAVIAMFLMPLFMGFTVAVMAASSRLSSGLPAQVGMKAFLIYLVVILILAVIFFVFYVRFIGGLCEALSLSSALYFILFLFAFPVAEFVASFRMGTPLPRDADADKAKEVDAPAAAPGKKGLATSLESSLESLLGNEEEEDYMKIWNSGIITFSDMKLMD